jgi:hypothetical protein
MAALGPAHLGSAGLAGRAGSWPSIVAGAGDASAGQMPHQAALALAERLGVTPVSFPGDHQGFATDPAPFADTVHKALRRS